MGGIGAKIGSTELRGITLEIEENGFSKLTTVHFSNVRATLGLVAKNELLQ